MTNENAVEAIARAIRAAIAHPIASMRLLPESEEELAVEVINALEEAGFELVRRDAQA